MTEKTPAERHMAVHRAVLGLCQEEFGRGGGGLLKYIAAIRTELSAMENAAQALGYEVNK